MLGDENNTKKRGRKKMEFTKGLYGRKKRWWIFSRKRYEAIENIEMSEF